MPNTKKKRTTPKDDNSQALALIEKSNILNPNISLDEILRLTRELNQFTPTQGTGSGKGVWYVYSPWFFFTGTIPDKDTSFPPSK